MVYGITGLDQIKIKQFDPLFVKIIVAIFMCLIIYYLFFYRLN